MLNKVKISLHLFFFTIVLVAVSVQAAEQSVLLAAMGDVMLARTVPQHIPTRNSAWPWEKIAPLMAGADLRCCNLECAVASSGVAIPKRYSFRADPSLTREVLHAGKIDIVSLANNHTFDFGRSALTETMRKMKHNDIHTVGAGVGRPGALTPCRIIKNGLKLSFIAYTWWTPEGYLPSETGIDLATLDETTLVAELHKAKQQTDLLIVSFHWGTEYAPAPSAYQQRIAHLAIDAGADLILGHHPHVAQAMEIYHNRPIFYSLGNCIFDRSDNRWSNGILALIRLRKNSVTVEKSIPLDIIDARPTPQLSIIE